MSCGVLAHGHARAQGLRAGKQPPGSALLQAERMATSESSLKAHVWLLPAAHDAVVVMAI